MNEATKVQDAMPPGRAAAPTAELGKGQRGGNRPAPFGPDFASWIIAERWFSLLVVHGIVFWVCVLALLSERATLAHGLVLLIAVIAVAGYWLLNWSWYKANRTWISIRLRNRRKW